MNKETISWKLIDKYFKDNPNSLVAHHLESFNDFFRNGIKRIFYENKHLWKGCFGCMSVITHDYLTFINSKYKISILLDYVLDRYNRCSFERVIACILQKEQVNASLLGNIHKYCEWGITYYQIYN